MNLRSASVTLLLGTLALLLVTALGWFLLIGPTLGELGAVGERRTAAQDRSATMSVQLAGLRKQVEQLPETDRQAAAIGRALPATADQPGFFAAVADAAADAGIRAEKVTDITQGVPQVVGGEDEAAPDDADLVVPESLAGAKVALQLVTVTVEADYDKLVRLVGNIESMDRVLYMTNVDVATDDSEGASRSKFTLTITGVAVIAPPIETPEAGRAGSAGGQGGASDGDAEQASG